MEERGLCERLPRGDVTDGGRAAVAQQLEDLEPALREQVEGSGGVALQEEGLLAARRTGLRDLGEAAQLVVVEVHEQLCGAEVGDQLAEALRRRICL